MRIRQLSGFAATAFIAATGAASAANMTFTGMPVDCSGCTVTVITSGSLYTPPSPLPFTPLDLGNSSMTGLVTSSTINNPGGGISSISFATGTGATSGEYAGNSVGTALSPFGGPTDGSGDTGGGANYLVAEGNGGTVTIQYLGAQTSLDVLWGTVDQSPIDYNQLSFSTGTQTITGADIAAIIGSSSFTDSNMDVAVEITGLTAFTTLTATDTANPAFEFDVAAVPAPAIGHGFPVALGFGGMLFGVWAWGRGKKCFALGAPASQAA